MSGNVENLTNEELHKKLLESGFANVPVTATTRKILERKLVTFLGGGDAKPNKNRRETIQVAPPLSSESEDSDRGQKQLKEKREPPKSTSRRATVAAAPSASSFVPPGNVSITPQKNTRRSGRVTPTRQTQPDVIVSTVPAVPAILEDTDDDDVIIVEDTSPPRSKSKSPSLSRSDIVTTSYKQVRDKVADLDEFNEQELEYEAEEEEVENTYNNKWSPAKDTYKLSDRMDTYEYGGPSSASRLSYTVPSVTSIKPRSSLFSYSSAMAGSKFNADKPNYSQSRQYVEEMEDDEVDNELDIQPIVAKAKHFNDVSRRWEQLVSEPLDSGLKYRSNIAYKSAVSGRHPIRETELKSGLAVLERKYRWYIITAFLMLVFILAYVLFFT